MDYRIIRNHVNAILRSYFLHIYLLSVLSYKEDIIPDDPGSGEYSKTGESEQDGGTITQTDQNYIATETDESGVYVYNKCQKLDQYDAFRWIAP